MVGVGLIVGVDMVVVLVADVVVVVAEGVVDVVVVVEGVVFLVVVVVADVLVVSVGFVFDVVASFNENRIFHFVIETKIKKQTIMQLFNFIYHILYNCFKVYHPPSLGCGTECNFLSGSYEPA